MKWIGQHIWDFISRFRSDVYLENIEDGTVASDKFLGLDSNNKIVKETVSAAVTDLHSAGVDGSANQLLTDDGDGTVSSESGLTFNGTTLASTALIHSQTNALVAAMIIENSGDNAQGGQITLRNSRDGADGQDDDQLGVIYFQGFDDGTPSSQVYGSIETTLADATAGQEAGKMEFKVAEFDGTTSTVGLLIDGDTDANGEIDVTIGAGAASVTTIAGTLTMGSTAAMTNAGLLSVAAQTNITSLGTLTNLDVDNININGDTITASADLSIVATGDDIAVDTNNFVIESATNGKPNLELKTTYAGNKPANIYFKKDKGAAGADDDFIGRIYFVSDNDAQEQIEFANISGEVRLAADGAEEGKFAINIKNTNNASLPQESFLLTANGAATDVNLGFGATSVTTVAGDLKVNGTPLVGWHGSSTRIKILPRDFVVNDGGRPVMIEDDSIGSNELFLFSVGNSDAFAYVPIPAGYKATHVRIYGNTSGENFYVYEGNIDSKTIVDIATGATAIGSEKTLGTELTSDTTNYLIIRVTSGGTTEEIHGGYVTIAQV